MFVAINLVEIWSPAFPDRQEERPLRHRAPAAPSSSATAVAILLRPGDRPSYPGSRAAEGGPSMEGPLLSSPDRAPDRDPPLDGPNLYRLDPAMKLEVAIGRRRTWYGRREPGAVRARSPRRGCRGAEPARDRRLADWVRRLRAPPRTARRPGHRAPLVRSRPLDRRLAVGAGGSRAGDRRGRAAPRRARRPAGIRGELTPRTSAARERIVARVAAAEGAGPSWIRDADRRFRSCRSPARTARRRRPG